MLPVDITSVFPAKLPRAVRILPRFVLAPNALVLTLLALLLVESLALLLALEWESSGIAVTAVNAADAALVLLDMAG